MSDTHRPRQFEVPSPACATTHDAHAIRLPAVGARGGAVVLAGVGILATLAMREGMSWHIAILPIAFVFGVTQVGGRCGTAHVNSMTAALRWGVLPWVTATGAYTLAGCLSATATGLVFAAIGTLVRPLLLTGEAWLLSAVCAVIVLRELGWIRLRIPERDWQTNRNWAYRMGWTRASALWGLHIGVGFATVITYGSYWLLVLVALLRGDPFYGAGLFAVYWLGRCAPLWLLPWVFPHSVWSSKLWRDDFRLANALGVAAIALCFWSQR